MCYYKTGPDHQEDKPVWDIMSARHFYVFTIPFDMDGPTEVMSSFTVNKHRILF